MSQLVGARARAGALAIAAGVGAALCATSLVVGGVAGVRSPSTRGAAVATPHPYLVMLTKRATPAPPTTAECEILYGYACYSPQQLQGAYDEAPLFAKGDNGKGETIVIVDAFGSPTITADLKTFDAGFKLPAPPSFKIIAPVGAIPAWDGSSTRVSWAEETSLDVEYAHAIAPGANILLVETPVAETEGTAGFPQIVKAENYVISHKLGQVISQSFGSTEELFPAGGILKLRSAYVAAQKAGVTVLAGSGDNGATDASDATGTTYYTKPVNSWPSSDPLVTSVGGLHFYLNATGGQTQPAVVWNDTALAGSPAASGGGDSAVFSRPSFQSTVSSVVGTWRGTPDISLSASIDGGALVYLSAKIVGVAGYYPVGGTSEATPEFAGIVAIADQVAGKSLGYLNPALYAMEAAKDAGIVDITSGTNTVTFSQGGKSYTVKGSTAVAGYDMASGVGTVDAASFVPELVGEAKTLKG